MIRVAYRGMLDAVCGGNENIPRKNLRGLKCNSIEEYASIIADNVKVDA